MEMEIGGGTQVVGDDVAQWKNGHVVARAGTRGGSHPVGRFWRRIRPRASSRGGGERLHDEVHNEGGGGSSHTSASANGSWMRSGGGSSQMSATAISYIGGGRVAPRST